MYGIDDGIERAFEKEWNHYIQPEHKQILSEWVMLSCGITPSALVNLSKFKFLKRGAPL